MGYLIAIALGVITASLFHLYTKNGRRRLPPSPWGLPVFGHLHLLGELPHRSLENLSNKFGPIMYLRLGQFPTIVCSSPAAAELVLKTHDPIFASRPKSQAVNHFFYGQKNLAWGEYGPRWRNLRKLCTLELLSSSKIESMKPKRKEDVNNLIRWLVDASKVHSVVDVSVKVESLIEDITYGMIFGHKDGRFDFKSSVQEIMKLAGAFNLADYVPVLGVFDLQGLGGRIKAVSKQVDGYLESIIEEHVRDASTGGKDHQHLDFIDVMLSLTESKNGQLEQLDRDTMKAVVLDMIVGAMDTTTTAIIWALSELFKHPKAMKKVQAELEDVVREDRMVQESDLVKLDYLDAVIKESMRLHPVAPLLLPHESMEDLSINGYYIPKKCRVIVNTWTIGRDARVWSENVNEFYPERFMQTNMDFKGHDLRFTPFGSGRRGCPGQQLGAIIVQLVVAQLVHCFNWELPNGMLHGDLDMNEKFGVTMTRATHLLAIPTIRFRSNSLSKF
uniref:Cytochrome P450 n=1 Tax=Sinopodophyllum hexandrum TaxID=93608 RepID=A0A0N9HR00_SINHE|nr:cytochrome P450 [Sinopodophyllum hexandrum]